MPAIINLLSRVKVYRYYERAEPAYFGMQAFVVVGEYIDKGALSLNGGSACVLCA